MQYFNDRIQNKAKATQSKTVNTSPLDSPKEGPTKPTTSSNNVNNRVVSKLTTSGQ